DGQLWLGGEGGLLRFDGVQFTPWKPPDGQALPDERIYGLLGANDGSLWIGTGRGLAQWKNDKLTVYAKLGRFGSILEDHQGTIWAGHTWDPHLLPPLCRITANEFKCFAFSDDPKMDVTHALQEDRNGDLWIGSIGTVCRWRSGKSDCYAIPIPRLKAVYAQVLAIDSDGTVWVDGGATGIWQLKSGRWKHYDEFPELKL